MLDPSIEGWKVSIVVSGGLQRRKGGVFVLWWGLMVLLLLRLNSREAGEWLLLALGLLRLMGSHLVKGVGVLALHNFGREISKLVYALGWMRSRS